MMDNDKIDYEFLFKYLIGKLIEYGEPPTSDAIMILKDMLATCPRSATQWNMYSRKRLPIITCCKCNGSGVVWVNDQKTIYDNCINCNGVGARFKHHMEANNECGMDKNR